jgi:hypothetical protein
MNVCVCVCVCVYVYVVMCIDARWRNRNYTYCPRHNIILPAEMFEMWQCRDRMSQKFWKRKSCLVMENTLILLINFVVMCCDLLMETYIILLINFVNYVRCDCYAILKLWIEFLINFAYCISVFHCTWYIENTHVKLWIWISCWPAWRPNFVEVTQATQNIEQA